MIGPIPEIGLDDPRVLAIAELVRAELAQEVEAGFPVLSRIPSTGIVQFLDNFATLEPADRMSLLDALARIAALNFFPAPLIARAHEQLRTTDSILIRFYRGMQSGDFAYGLRYLDVRMARAAVRDPETMAHMARTRAALDFQPRDDLPELLVGSTPLRDIQTVRAPQLRKLLNPMLLKRLGAKPQKRLGGELVYEGMIGDIPLRVSIIFSNIYAQMHYAVTWSVRERALLAQRFNYEIMWGSNTGWDYLTEENAARSIDLLDQLLLRLAGCSSASSPFRRPRQSGLRGARGCDRLPAD
jgi:hypothetical protein